MIVCGPPLPADAPVCRYCRDAIHDGNTCLECWRDLRELANARDREWWREAS